MKWLLACSSYKRKEVWWLFVPMHCNHLRLNCDTIVCIEGCILPASRSTTFLSNWLFVGLYALLRQRRTERGSKLLWAIMKMIYVYLQTSQQPDAFIAGACYIIFFLRIGISAVRRRWAIKHLVARERCAVKCNATIVEKLFLRYVTVERSIMFSGSFLVFLHLHPRMMLSRGCLDKDQSDKRWNVFSSSKSHHFIWIMCLDTENSYP